MRLPSLLPTAYPSRHAAVIKLMTSKKVITIVVLLAVLMTFASTFVTGSTHASYLDAGCAGSCRVVAAGFPFPFIADYPGISPVGSVSLSEAIIGVDHFLISPFVASYMCWVVFVAVIIRLLSLVKR